MGQALVGTRMMMVVVGIKKTSMVSVPSWKLSKCTEEQSNKKIKLKNSGYVL